MPQIVAVKPTKEIRRKRSSLITKFPILTLVGTIQENLD
jgi:hypothetical protein